MIVNIEKLFKKPEESKKKDSKCKNGPDMEAKDDKGDKFARIGSFSK